MTPKEIGQRIAGARKSARLSQSQLARAVALSESTLGRIERGQSYPDTFTLEEIAALTSTSVDQLLGSRPLVELDDVATETAITVGF